MSSIFLRIKNALNYRKPYFWMVIITVVIVVVAAASFGTDSKYLGTKENSYTYSGTSSVKLGDQYFIAEDTPESPVYSGVTVSSLTDEEYSALNTQQIENPQKSDFRKVSYKLHVEYPENTSNRNVELPIVSLIDKNGESRYYWSLGSFGKNSKKENSETHGSELIMYVRGLNNNDIRKMFFSSNGFFGSVNWTDENNNQIQYIFTLGDHIIFEDDVRE